MADPKVQWTPPLLSLLQASLGPQPQPAPTPTPQPNVALPQDQFQQASTDRPASELQMPLTPELLPGQGDNVTVTGQGARELANDPRGWGVSVGVEGSYNVTGSEPRTDGNFRTSEKLTITGQTSVNVSVNGKAKALELSHKQLVGVRTTYEMNVTSEEAAQIRAGQRPIPTPFQPETMPVGSSVLLRGENFQGTQLEGTYKALSVSTGTNSSAGTSIAVEKTGESTVRVTVGPTESVGFDGFVGVGVGPFKAGVGGEKSARYTESRVVEIDLSKPEGRAAYNKLLLTGEIPRSNPEGGVTSSATQRNVEIEESNYAQFGVDGVIDLKTRLQGSGLDAKTIDYDDGRRAIENSVSVNGQTASINQTFDECGVEDLSQREFKLVMNRYDPASAGYAHTAFGGTQDEGNALIGGPQRDVVLTLNHDQFVGMRDQAREVMDKKLAEYQALPGGERYQSYDDLPISGSWELIRRIAKSNDEGDLAQALVSSNGIHQNYTAEAFLLMRAETGRPVPGQLQTRPTPQA